MGRGNTIDVVSIQAILATFALLVAVASAGFVGGCGSLGYGGHVPGYGGHVLGYGGHGFVHGAGFGGHGYGLGHLGYGYGGYGLGHAGHGFGYGYGHHLGYKH
ncbi:glycine-rich protein-like isoform X1 [Dermacentor albipictus]|uniref:glycine-rich protein-like isoform X1 n=1 Tax=Dermacentor albipictus TaxID=60249 RepID=UPI0038FC2E7F